MLLFLLACTPVPTPVPAVDRWRPADEPGGWAVGVRTEQVADPRGGELVVEVWYPASDDGAPADYGLPYALDSLALRDATPTGGPHPLVMFSHGHGGARQQSVFLTEHLASHGFVVVAVDHPHDTIFDYDEDLVPVVAARRPDDVRFALDWALASTATSGHWLDGGIDTGAVGMLGHSFGAWTSLVLGGGVLDVEQGIAYCEAMDPAGCGIVGAIELDGPPPAPDPRITATMLLAPGGWYSFSDLGGVGPALVVSGSRDGDLPFEEEQRPTFDALGTPRTLMVLENGGHFGFTDGCALVPLADCAGADDGYMEPLRMQALTKTVVTAFAGVELLGEPRYAAWLEALAWPDDEVRWEAVD
ncbi:MAG: hypothetical protein H6737_11615 [Alphaproteobacteria bacterium]|nr:hypothetical protein [Alphaproteobacteria bacterium]